MNEDFHYAHLKEDAPQYTCQKCVDDAWADYLQLKQDGYELLNASQRASDWLTVARVDYKMRPDYKKDGTEEEEEK